MNAPHASTAAAVRNAEAGVAIAAEALSKHGRDTRSKFGAAAALEAEMQSHRVAVALGDAAEHDGPDAAALAILQADLAMAPAIEERLQARLSAAQGVLTVAERSHKAAVAAYLEEAAVAPAREELASAFNTVRDAAVKLMAAHNLAYRKFNDRAPAANSVMELHGPVSELIGELRELYWSNYPYSIRPQWLPANGRFFPDEMPGVAEATEALLADVAAKERAI